MANWLNAEPDSQLSAKWKEVIEPTARDGFRRRQASAKRRITALIRMITELCQMASRPADHNTREILNALDDVNRRVQRLRVRLNLALADGRAIIHAVGHGEESQILPAFQELGRLGLLNRMRMCSPTCGRWFFAKLERQHFCSTNCRTKAFRQSVEGKKKRAEYMRSYRKRLKELESFFRTSRRKSEARKSERARARIRAG